MLKNWSDKIYENSVAARLQSADTERAQKNLRVAVVRTRLPLFNIIQCKREPSHYTLIVDFCNVDGAMTTEKYIKFWQAFYYLNVT